MVKWVTLEFDIEGLHVVILGKTHVSETEIQKLRSRNKDFVAIQPENYSTCNERKN